MAVALLALAMISAPAHAVAARQPQLIVGFRTSGTATERAHTLRRAGATYASRSVVAKTTITPLRAVVVPVTAKSLA